MSRTWIVIISGAVGVVSVLCAAAGRPGAQPGGPVKAVMPGLTGLQVFPADNPWNTDVSHFPVHANSLNFLTTIGLTRGLHPDFGTVYNGAPNGIPFVVVQNEDPLAPIAFTLYGNQSDPGPYPIRIDAPIEGGPNSTGDRHVIAVDPVRKKLYELYRAFPQVDGSWQAGSGAVFDLTSNALRHEQWTSADAAGLPIFPGLVRYDEAVTKGVINHALRFTVQSTQHGYIQPAVHWASSSTDPNRPPMGLRVRLKPSVNEMTFPAMVRPIIVCMKKYGMIVADNGSNWFVSGAPDPRWSDDDLATLSRIKGQDFEVIDTGPIVTH